jgi:hypothetical protein
MANKLAAIGVACAMYPVLSVSSVAQPGAPASEAQVAIMACLNSAIDRQRVTRAGRLMKLICDGSPSRVLYDRLHGLVETVTVEWGEVRSFSRTPGVTSNTCTRIARHHDGSPAEYVYCELHINLGELSHL